MIMLARNIVTSTSNIASEVRHANPLSNAFLKSKKTITQKQDGSKVCWQ